MPYKIPTHLYRGDADSKNIRDLKTTLGGYQLQTNLLKGGRGHDVFSTPLLELVGKHVDPGWAKTHFLSFSEDEITALRFGIGCAYEEVDRELDKFMEHYNEPGSPEDWTFALITIDNTRIMWEELNAGIYLGTYKPTLIKFHRFPGLIKVVLIDVARVVANSTLRNLAVVRSNAERDKEWLLLPATETLLNDSIIEFSGIIDGGCISDIRKYKKVR